MYRSLRITLLSAIALAVLAAPAAAKPPAGEWTFLRKDAFRHYACKAATKAGWQIRTATFLNGSDDARRHRIGAYVALARGGDDRPVAWRNDVDWDGAYIRLALRGARNGDRVWAQGAYYGPAAAWRDGTPVAEITRCGKR